MLDNIHFADTRYLSQLTPTRRWRTSHRCWDRTLSLSKTLSLHTVAWGECVSVVSLSHTHNQRLVPWYPFVTLFILSKVHRPTKTNPRLLTTNPPNSWLSYIRIPDSMTPLIIRSPLQPLWHTSVISCCLNKRCSFTPNRFHHTDLSKSVLQVRREARYRYASRRRGLASDVGRPHGHEDRTSALRGVESGACGNPIHSSSSSYRFVQKKSCFS